MDSKITCPLCDKSFSKQFNLNRHMSRSHKQVVLDTPKSNTSFICTSEVLNSTPASLDETNVYKMQLITQHDLYNIETDFGLNNDSVHDTDAALSIDAWVKSEKRSKSNCVICYKPQGIDCKILKNDDFSLGIMTQAQIEMFKKYGNDMVCIDGTHEMNACDFQVVTLMVIDDMCQGFPCAFYITNRTDKQSIEVFLSAIKSRIGVVKPSVFMSDIADSFYNAWCAVMEPATKRLFCTWHVDRAWQTNLSKIKDTEKKKETCQKLRVLLEETDEKTFLKMLGSVVEELSSNETTKEYGEYFKNYTTCYESWAYAFRKNVGLDSNTNMHLESLHRVVTHLFLKGKSVKRFDKAIHAIMQIVKQTLIDRLLILEKGKVTTKLQGIRRRHQMSLIIKTETVTSTNDNKWEVSSSILKDTYIVSLSEPNNCDCRLRCTSCKACIHMYRCTCIDASVKWNMCTHIHLVCTKLNEAMTNQNDVVIMDTESLVIDTNFEEDENFKAILNGVGSKETSPNDTSESLKKMQLKEQFKRIMVNVNTPEDFKLTKQVLNNLEATLSNLNIKYKSNISLITGTETKCNVNKYIQPERRCFSTIIQNKNVFKSKRQTKKDTEKIAAQVILMRETPSTSYFQ